MSLRAYARRRGCSAPSVLRAVRSQRLKDSLIWIGGIAQIADPELADQEWGRNTDHSRAPGYVKTRGTAVTLPTVTPVTPAVEVRTVPPAAAQGGTSLADAATREKFALAQIRELELQHKRGELMPVKESERRLDEMQERYTDLCTLIRTKLLAVASQVKGDCQELTLAHVAAIEARIRLALEALADGEGIRT